STPGTPPPHAGALRRTAATCCCAHSQHPARTATCSPNSAAPYPTSIRTLKICCMRRCNAHSSPLPATPIARAPLPEIDEAWKVAKEQAILIDDLRAAALEQREKTTTGLGDSVTDDGHPDDDDASGRDGASVDLTMISRAEVIDVTGKAVAAQARLTMMRTDHPSGSRAPPPTFNSRYQLSSMTPGTDTPLHRQPSTTSQVSRVSAARKRSRRKSKASLRLPASVSARSHSTARSARSKSRNKKGKEPAQAEHPLPWLPTDMEGSFLEMEGRPAGDDCEEDGSEGDGGDDDDGRADGELSPNGAQTGP
ncbi:hypothetical protein BJV78DRAFT_1233421, partial [Lactifluus subvellereus]